MLALMTSAEYGHLSPKQLVPRLADVNLLTRIPPAHRMADPAAWEENDRLRREASAAAGLSHPNVVQVFDRGEWDGTYYIAMEYLEGRSLKERIVSDGPLPISAAIDVTSQILRAIGFAHRRGIVHRDIKPHNVLLAQDGPGEPRFKVTDFGISRTTASQMTEAGSIVGTAQYLSPEQARGAPVDQRSDIYSVGIVLYELLTGKLPFSGETPLEIAMKHLSEIPRAPSDLRPEVSADLDMIVLRALAKDPEDRFGTAAEMERELSRVAGGGGVTAETAEAATAVLSGAGLAETAPTMISRRPVVAPREAGIAGKGTVGGLGQVGDFALDHIEVSALALALEGLAAAVALLSLALLRAAGGVSAAPERGQHLLVRGADPGGAGEVPDAGHHCSPARGCRAGDRPDPGVSTRDPLSRGHGWLEYGGEA